MLNTLSARASQTHEDLDSAPSLAHDNAELRTRLRQQSTLAEIGLLATAAQKPLDLLSEAAARVANCLEFELGIVLELLPDGETLALRVCFGSKEEALGEVIPGVLADGVALRSLLVHEPVILEDGSLERWPHNHLFRRHGIVSWASVVIPGTPRPYGVLGIAATSPRRCTPDAVRFLQGAARILAAALERQRLTAGLKESGQLFRLAWDSVSNGLRLTDAEGTVRLVNDAYCRMVEKSKRSLEGMPLSIVHAAEQQSDVLSTYQRRHAAGTLHSPLDTSITLWNGKTLRLELTNCPAELDGQKDLVLSVINDVTERRLAQAECGQLLRERTELADHIGLLLESTTEGIFGVDLHGHCTFINRAATMMLGYKPGEMVGKKVHDLIHPGGAPLKEDECPLCHALQTGQTSRIENAELWRRDRESFPAQYSCHPIVQEGALRGCVITFSDTSERDRLESLVRHSQKMEAVGRLAGGIAHDFNNLLTVIMSYSNLLLTKLRSDEPAHQHAEEILKSAERAASLTRQLLAFSRKQVIKPRLLDLAVVLADMKQVLERLVGEQIELRLARDEQSSPIEADPGQIQQIILNLAINARDAMPSGGRLSFATSNVQFDVAYAGSQVGVKPGSYVLLIVSDTGCGMTEEVQTHLFEPFFTTKDPGKGTGLGLSTVYGIVKQGGGHIEVRSAPRLGTTFRIFLPRSRESAPMEEPHSACGRSYGQAQTILVVEDEDTVRCLIRMVLRWNGYTVLEARNGEEALALCKQNQGPIDLLLTDVILPLMNGPTIAEHLLRLRPGLKVLYMSGHPGEELDRLGVRESSSAFLAKPFTPDALSHSVAEMFGGERADSSLS